MKVDRDDTHAEDGRTRLAVNLDRIIKAAGKGNGETLASILGMNRTTLYKWRTSRELPDSIESLWSIADHAGLSLDALVGRDGPAMPAAGEGASLAGVAEILAAIAEVKRSMEAIAISIVRQRGLQTATATSPRGSESRNVTVNPDFTVITCERCGGAVRFPESTPSHQLAAALERFRRSHAACTQNGEDS